jgi:hypothetical protein
MIKFYYNSILNPETKTPSRIKIKLISIPASGILKLPKIKKNELPFNREQTNEIPT